MGLTLKLIGAGTLTASDATLMLNAVGTGKAMIVKCMRFTNTTGSAVVATMKFNRVSPAFAKTAFKQSIAANASAVDSGEIVLEYGDHLFGLAASASAIDYVISGIERDI